jgi:hypothetical protein
LLIDVLKFSKKLGKSFLKPNKVPRTQEFYFSRPLVLLQSDDWGRVGVRDQEGFALLHANAMALGENPYDFYTLESTGDVTAVCDLLQRHRDSTGRPACLAANFILANVDFGRIAADRFRKLYLLPLTEGLPGNWSRPGLFAAYQRGITDGVFYPGLHGLTHFCRPMVEHALEQNGERAALLRKLWQAETPYIFWRMPWIGHEYCKPENPEKGFLKPEIQDAMIREAADIFSALFSRAPISACAPGYRANQDTRVAWGRHGVRVAQSGPGGGALPCMDEHGLLTLSRTLDFEPALAEPSLATVMQLARESVDRGAPLIVSIHSINFHSTVRNFRDPTLRALDVFLSALEAKYPDLLYVHDADLYEIVTTGKFASPQGVVSVITRRCVEL